MHGHAPEEGIPDCPEGSVGTYLEDLSHRIINLNLNSRALDHPLILKHMDAGLRAKHDTLPTVGGLQRHQAYLKKHLENIPNMTAEVLNTSSDVDESRGRGTVYVWYKLSGVEFDFTREVLAKFSWEKREQVWRIVRHEGMRGSAGFAT